MEKAFERCSITQVTVISAEYIVTKLDANRILIK